MYPTHRVMKNLVSGQTDRGCRRPHPWALPVLLFFFALLLTACGVASPEIQPFTYNAAPWFDGEVSIYRITDVKGDLAGTVRYDLSAGGRSVAPDDWTLRREVVTRGENEIVVVEMTNSGLRPRSAMLVRTGSDGAERVETQYNGSQVDMKLTTVRDVTTYQRASAPSDARDARTVPHLVRMLPLDDGYATRFNSYLPVADSLERITLQVIGREQVDVPAGAFDAWHVRLDTTDSRSEVWIGVEPPHPLVKYHDGRSDGVYALAEYEPGNAD